MGERSVEDGVLGDQGAGPRQLRNTLLLCGGEFFVDGCQAGVGGLALDACERDRAGAQRCLVKAAVLLQSVRQRLRHLHCLHASTKVV